MSVDLIISPSQSPDAAGQPHLVSLVLQSKKALQVGEQWCSRAHAANQASAQAAVDVLALDAKVRWIGKAVVDQLKVCLADSKLQLADTFPINSLQPELQRPLRRSGRILTVKYEFVISTTGIRAYIYLVYRNGTTHAPNARTH